MIEQPSWELQRQLPTATCLLPTAILPKKNIKEAKHMISVGDLTTFLSKWILFLILQIAQQIAASPTYRKFSLRGKNCFAHNQNWSNEHGLQSVPTTYATKLQTYLAMELSKNKWLTDSFSRQKLHLLSPCQPLRSDYPWLGLSSFQPAT